MYSQQHPPFVVNSYRLWIIHYCTQIAILTVDYQFPKKEPHLMYRPSIIDWIHFIHSKIYFSLNISIWQKMDCIYFIYDLKWLNNDFSFETWNRIICFKKRRTRFRWKCLCIKHSNVPSPSMHLSKFHFNEIQVKNRVICVLHKA